MTSWPLVCLKSFELFIRNIKNSDVLDSCFQILSMILENDDLIGGHDDSTERLDEVLDHVIGRELFRDFKSLAQKTNF